MMSTTEQRYDFVPTTSIAAFVFIIVGLIGRCLALNQSTVRSAQSLDLVIYPVQPKVRPSTDLLYDSVDNREQRVLFDESVPVHRGPKNL